MRHRWDFGKSFMKRAFFTANNQQPIDGAPIGAFGLCARHYAFASIQFNIQLSNLSAEKGFSAGR